MWATVRANALAQRLGPKPQIMLNLNHPSEAYRLAALAVDGVGWLPLETLITQDIQVHPLALLHFEQILDPQLREQIHQKTLQYEDKSQFLVDRLAQAMGTIAAAFHPRPVLVHFSNLRSDVAQHLLGGSLFEPVEENPLMGWRGAVRYTDDRYRAAFSLECQALRRVRDGVGLTNLVPVIPYCRTVQEAQLVLEELARQGLESGKQGLRIYLSLDLPGTALRVDQFCALFDGMVLNLSHLSQLILGLDAAADLPLHLEAEMGEVWQRLLQTAVSVAQEHDLPIGVVTNNALTPELLDLLLKHGISFLSIQPNDLALLQTPTLAA